MRAVLLAGVLLFGCRPNVSSQQASTQGIGTECRWDRSCRAGQECVESGFRDAPRTCEIRCRTNKDCPSSWFCRDLPMEHVTMYVCTPTDERAAWERAFRKLGEAADAGAQ